MLLPRQTPRSHARGDATETELVRELSASEAAGGGTAPHKQRQREYATTRRGPHPAPGVHTSRLSPRSPQQASSFRLTRSPSLHRRGYLNAGRGDDQSHSHHHQRRLRCSFAPRDGGRRSNSFFRTHTIYISARRRHNVCCRHRLHASGPSVSSPGIDREAGNGGRRGRREAEARWHGD